MFTAVTAFAAISVLATTPGLPADEGAAPPARAPVDWTVMIYGAADNNADGHMFDFLQAVRGAVADDPAIELVLFMDRSTGFSTDARSLGEDFTGGRLYRLHAQTAERLAGGAQFPEMALDHECETDSADPETLRKFLAFGKANFPARRHALVIYSHASGITMCPDEQAGHDMGIARLTEVATEAEAVDFMGLELCNMGGIEIAYQWRPGNGGFSTDVLLAIPNAGPPLDWARIFGRVHGPAFLAAQTKGAADPEQSRADYLDPAKMTAAEFGRMAVEEGRKGRLARIAADPEHAERSAHEAAAAYDLLAVEEVKSAVDAFAVALAKADAKELLEKLRDAGPDGAVMNYSGDQFNQRGAFVDLYDLLRRAAACEALGEEPREAARAAMAATDACVLASFGMSGYRGFEPGRNGVFIAFPDGDAPTAAILRKHPRVWQEYAWYSPFDDASAPRAEGGRMAGGTWSWCRDGATRGDQVVENWFELLDCWFDANNDEGGGDNGWRW